MRTCSSRVRAECEWVAFPQWHDPALTQKETHWNDCAKPCSDGSGVAGEKSKGW